MRNRCARFRSYARIGFVLWIAGAAVLLGGCALNRVFIPEVHKVQQGESLSSIAAAYGLNWHNLARWNDIPAPYTIYVGQRLTLDPFPPLNYDRMRRQRQAAQTTRHPTPRSTVTRMPADRGFSVTRLPAPRSQPGPAAPGQPPTDQRVESAAPVPVPAPAPESTGDALVDRGTQSGTTSAAQPASAQRSTAPPMVSAEGWRWPLATAVLKDNNTESTRHGVDLQGAIGTPVYAARGGQVVYSGPGLQGIGQLVIIKHDGDYLSAYGYVKNVLVKEGDRIDIGEHIADMGAGPGSRAALHFEVRHEGEPIDPESVLPDL